MAVRFCRGAPNFKETLMQYTIKDIEHKTHYGLDDQTINQILSKMPIPKYMEFLYMRHYFEIERMMPGIIKGYRNIKDSTWPECYSIDDFRQLPSWVLEECKNVHGFNLFFWEQNPLDLDFWESYQGGAYPVQDLVRMQHTLFDNLEYIEDCRVIDFAGHSGSFSLAALQNRAKFVSLTNVRSEFLNVANECMTLAGYEHKFQTHPADIHNYELNTKLCQQVDTVLLFGIIYHLHDHFSVLESIARTSPQTIIIDTVEDTSIMNNPKPLMSWLKEPTNSVFNAYHNDFDYTISGIPNTAWLDQAMTLLGYQVRRTTTYHKFNQSCADAYGAVAGAIATDAYYQSTHVYVLNK